MQAAQPHVVFHLAAQPLVRYSYLEPIETYEVNIMGTVNVLEAVRHSPGVKAVVNVTTDKCYENREWVWPYRENEAMGGFDPYSSSKACSELITAAYRNSFLDHVGVHLASARAGNVIGGGDWSADRLVPDFLRAIDAGQTLMIRSPQAIRPWQHVLEPLSGYLMLGRRALHPWSGFCGGLELWPGRRGCRAGAVDRRIPMQTEARRNAGNATPRRGLTRPTRSNWIARRQRHGLAGDRAGLCRPHSAIRWNGTRPGGQARIWPASACSKFMITRQPRQHEYPFRQGCDTSCRLADPGAQAHRR